MAGTAFEAGTMEGGGVGKERSQKSEEENGERSHGCEREGRGIVVEVVVEVRVCVRKRAIIAEQRVG